jgi:hypothetical protein
MFVLDDFHPPLEFWPEEDGPRTNMVYVSSWIDDKLERCYQLMETHERALLDEWMSRWSDLIEFEVYPVVTSQEAVQRVAPRL